MGSGMKLCVILLHVLFHNYLFRFLVNTTRRTYYFRMIIRPKVISTLVQLWDLSGAKGRKKLLSIVTYKISLHETRIAN